MVGMKPKINPALWPGIVARYNAGEDQAKLGAEFGVSRDTISSIIRKSGGKIEHRGGIKETDDELQKKVIEEYGKGKGATTIARAVGVNKTTVYNILHRNGLGARPVSDRVYGEMQAPPPPEDKGPSRKEVFESQEYHKRFDNFLDPAVAYWVGVLMTDGCIVDTEVGRSNKVMLTRGDSDKEHLYQFLRFMGVERALVPCDHLDPAGNRQLGYNVSIVSNPICHRLVEYGVIPRKTLLHIRHTVKVSEHFIGSRDFWRGVFDGNGTVYTNITQMRVCVGNALQAQLEVFLRSVGISDALSYNRNQCGVDYCIFLAGVSRKLAPVLYAGAPPEHRLERKYLAAVSMR
jgi:hypothetical protein